MQRRVTGVKAITQRLDLVVVGLGDIAPAETLDHAIESGAQGTIVLRSNIVEGHRNDGLEEAVLKRSVGGGSGHQALQCRFDLDLLP